MDARIPSTEITYHRVQLLPGFKGLGISLTPNGIINAIEPNSPSDLAGLKKDYRIILVNNVDVRDKSNKEIARLIKENEANLVLGILKSGAETPLLIHKHLEQTTQKENEVIVPKGKTIFLKLNTIRKGKEGQGLAIFYNPKIVKTK